MNHYDEQVRLRQRVVWEMLHIVGRPGIWAGNGPEVFDCSGAYNYAGRGGGATIPGYVGFPDLTARRLERLLEGFGDPADALPGDALFYGRDQIATHVVMALTPGATVVCGANGVRSFRWMFGEGKKFRSDLTDAEFREYQAKMEELGACVRIETEGWRYRGHYRGGGRLPT